MSTDLIPQAVTAIHLDAVGGVAGDMFTASLCDAVPALVPAMEAAVDAVRPAGVTTALNSHSDGVLIGKRFVVDAPAEHHHDPADGHGHHHQHDAHEGHSHDHDHHHHRHWRDIRAMLAASALPAETRETAIGIFAHLADAEAAVHGIDVDNVTFHEVGAWDSIVDIVAAASIIAQLSQCQWTIGPLPIGRGMVKSAHGMLPVPAPATVRLLNGFITFDDGETGERITPTGAAIVAYLAPSQSVRSEHLRLVGSGTGHGTRRLERRSNVLRSLIFEAAHTEQSRDQVEVLRCEIDDQTGEDLAIAIAHLREQAGVLDVCQWPVVAKKGRIAIALQIIVAPEHADAVAAAVLDETTSLGVRRTTVARDILDRKQHDIDGTRVKVANRPSGQTAKAEADDVTQTASLSARQRARHQAETAALRRATEHDD